MRKVIFFTALAFLCLNISIIQQIKSQEKPSDNSVQPAAIIKVGDKLPDAFWTQNHLSYKGGKATNQCLSQYKGQILLLDFWAGWCSTCLKKWPMLDSVQKLYPGQIKIMLVNEKRNGDDLEKIRQKMDIGQPTKLESIYADTTLAAQFPHQLLPHYIWISEKAAVIAITGTDFMQKATIERLLSERNLRQNKFKR